MFFSAYYRHSFMLLQKGNFCFAFSASRTVGLNVNFPQCSRISITANREIISFIHPKSHPKGTGKGQNLTCSFTSSPFPSVLFSWGALAALGWNSLAPEPQKPHLIHCGAKTSKNPKVKRTQGNINQQLRYSQLSMGF